VEEAHILQESVEEAHLDTAAVVLDQANMAQDNMEEAHPDAAVSVLDHDEVEQNNVDQVHMDPVAAVLHQANMLHGVRKRSKTPAHVAEEMPTREWDTYLSGEITAYEVISIMGKDKTN
jgi:hypothetical protein